jgi:hypothetical protein
LRVKEVGGGRCIKFCRNYEKFWWLERDYTTRIYSFFFFFSSSSSSSLNVEMKVFGSEFKNPYKNRGNSVSTVT